MFGFGNLEENELDESMGRRAEVSLDLLSVFSATKCKLKDLIVDCNRVRSLTVPLFDVIDSITVVFMI